MKTLSRVTYTADSNIDFSKNAVIDESKVITHLFDSYHDMLMFKNTKQTIGNPFRVDSFINASLYDDIVTIDGIDCRILRMVTKSENQFSPEEIQKYRKPEIA